MVQFLVWSPWNKCQSPKGRGSELWYPRAEECRPLHSRKRKNTPPSYTVLLYVGPQQTGWCLTTSVRGKLLYSVYKHPQTHPEIMIYQLPGHLLSESSWCIKLIILWGTKCISQVIHSVYKWTLKVLATLNYHEQDHWLLSNFLEE